MIHLTYLQNFFIKFTPELLNYIRAFSVFLAFIINFIILISVDKTIKIQSGNSNRTEFRESNLKFLISVLGLCQILLIIIIFLFWIRIYSINSIKKGWRNYIIKNKLKYGSNSKQSTKFFLKKLIEI